MKASDSETNAYYSLDSQRDFGRLVMLIFGKLWKGADRDLTDSAVDDHVAVDL